MTFREATFFCNRYGGSLYALDSPSKNRIMLSYLTTVFGQGRRQKFWTGYYKAENALGWRWTTGSTSQYTDWEPGKPANTNEAIGAVAWGGTYHWSDTWQDEPLSSSFAFICQAPALTANGEPYPPPTTAPMQPGFGAGAGPGAGPGMAPNAPFNPVMPGSGPLSPVNPGATPLMPATGPVNPGAGPVNPRPGPINPNAGPVNPGTGPANPGTGPLIPRGRPNGRPINPNPRTPAVLQRLKGYASHVQNIMALP
nr:uncharacterized protein LOC129275674 [Lytechinus pictus]